jgi:hypothetical protein
MECAMTRLVDQTGRPILRRKGAAAAAASGLLLLAAVVVAGEALAKGGGHHRRRGAMVVQEPTCIVSKFKLCNGCTITASMQVSSDTTCHVTFKSGEVILANELTKRPQHGRYGTSSVSDAAYQPDSGYVGSDEFEFTVHRISSDGQKAKPVFVKVQVNVVE